MSGAQAGARITWKTPRAGRAAGRPRAARRRWHRPGSDACRTGRRTDRRTRLETAASDQISSWCPPLTVTWACTRSSSRTSWTSICSAVSTVNDPLERLAEADRDRIEPDLGRVARRDWRAPPRRGRTGRCRPLPPSATRLAAPPARSAPGPHPSRIGRSTLASRIQSQRSSSPSNVAGPRPGTSNWNRHSCSLSGHHLDWAGQRELEAVDLVVVGVRHPPSLGGAVRPGSGLGSCRSDSAPRSEWRPIRRVPRRSRSGV